MTIDELREWLADLEHAVALHRRIGSAIPAHETEKRATWLRNRIAEMEGKS